jgi:hypothetical protein
MSRNYAVRNWLAVAAAHLAGSVSRRHENAQRNRRRSTLSLSELRFRVAGWLSLRARET